MADNHEGWVGQNLEDMIAVIQRDIDHEQNGGKEPLPVNQPERKEEMKDPEPVPIIRTSDIEDEEERYLANPFSAVNTTDITVTHLSD